MPELSPPRLRVLPWHVHGSYTTQLFEPIKDTRREAEALATGG